ncbi:MAG: FAD binding domain-containing protein [Bacilli bacterium]|nr:FAD binding domain-containing protein [Bacilli bacterium]
MIQHFIPSNLNEALEILSKYNCFILAGGTDLMVQKHVSAGVLPHFEKDILYVMDLKELDYINLDSDKNIHIGASTRFIEIEESPLVPEIYKKVIREIASPNIRNMATMTGNIANASPAGDSIVPLVINDADVVLASANGERTVSVNDFILGVRKIDRKPDEMIKEIVLKPQELNYFYKKVGSRKAESITKVSFLGAYRVEDGIIKDFRVALGSVAIKVVRNTKVEKKYIGKSVKELKVNQVVQDYAKLIAPITDQRSNKEYRHKVAMNLLKKFLVDLKGETNE